MQSLSHHSRKKSVEAVDTVCPLVYLLSTLLCLQIFIAMTHLSSKMPLAPNTLSITEPHCGSSLISGCCPLSRRSYTFAYVRLYVFQQFNDCVDDRMGTFETLDLVLRLIRSWKTTSPPTLTPSGSLTSPAISSTLLPRKVQGPFFQVLQLVKYGPVLQVLPALP